MFAMLPIGDLVLVVVVVVGAIWIASRVIVGILAGANQVRMRLEDRKVQRMMDREKKL